MKDKLLEKYKEKLPNEKVGIIINGRRLEFNLHDRLEAMLEDMLSEGEEVFLEDKQLQADLTLLDSLTGFRHVYERWFPDELLIIQGEFESIESIKEKDEHKEEILIVTREELIDIIVNHYLDDYDSTDFYILLKEGMGGIENYSDIELKDEYMTHVSEEGIVLIDNYKNSKEPVKMSYKYYDKKSIHRYKRDRALALVYTTTKPIRYTVGRSENFPRIHNQLINKEEAVALLERYNKVDIVDLEDHVYISIHG